MFPYTEWGERVISVGLDGIVALPDMYMSEQHVWEKKMKLKWRRRRRLATFKFYCMRGDLCKKFHNYVSSVYADHLMLLRSFNWLFERSTLSACVLCSDLDRLWWSPSSDQFKWSKIAVLSLLLSWRSRRVDHSGDQQTTIDHIIENSLLNNFFFFFLLLFPICLRV